MMSRLYTNRSRWSQHAAVAVAFIAMAYLAFEILRSQLPGQLQATAWVAVAAAGLSLLCGGMGVVLVSGIRLFAALRKADLALVRSMAIDHLVSTALVLAGFVLSIGALSVLSQVRPL
jgi:hypothetical protein